MKSIRQLADMTERVSLITGGAGHIGTAMAEALAELGSHLLLLDRDEARLAPLAIELAGKWGVRVEYLVVDLERADTIPAVAREAERRFSRLDVLINNAAFVGTSDIGGWVTDFASQSVDTWKRALDVNLTSVFALTQACTGLLKASGNGSVINISSIYGDLGPDLRLYEGTAMGNPAAYAASKGGLNQLTRWLSTVLAPDIRVNTISPGGVYRGQPEVFCQRYIQRTPLARMATEEDFKGATAFLASDLSRYVTGQNLMVDGGWGIW
jgi:NAD(P)-dependent dehydrogenase (short-subunit alcohol dehydrogenase family)